MESKTVVDFAVAFATFLPWFLEREHDSLTS